jgi:hypothetical protein
MQKIQEELEKAEKALETLKHCILERKFSSKFFYSKIINCLIYQENFINFASLNSTPRQVPKFDL